MDKKLFWKGYFSGILATIMFVIYFMFYTPSLNYDDFKLKDLSGNTLINKDIFEQKPTVVNMWATWCKPCVAEFPSFEEMNTKFSGKVNIIMISEENISKIITFKEKKKYNLNIVKSIKTNAEYGISSIPVTYFFNKNGNLMTTKLGMIEKNELELEIKKLLD